MVDSAEIDARLEYLHEEYGDFPVETAETDLPADAYERAREPHNHSVPGAARVWVERDSKVLLVREVLRPDSWGVAGGLIEPDERADQAGVREVREETSIECEIVDIAYVHRATRRHEDGNRESIEEIAVAFVAEYIRGTPRPQEGEIREVKWWERVPEQSHPPATRIWAERLG